jgi:redox-sensitive bicupin YhaK (pirin superfamily)
MDRRDMIKKAIAGAGIIATGKVVADATVSKPVDIVGFNHLPEKKGLAMGNIILHKSSDRGHANHGWLNSFHSFSFASYYNPDKMHFGVLRVLNDDTVAPGMGFGTHPHDNMEIISIPLDGDLEHKDSMGNTTVIRQGDIQVMSAGTGIRHSEYNKNKDKEVKFLQIWLFPNKKGVTPRYDQISLDPAQRNNTLQQVLSPSADDEGVWIHQDAWFHMGRFDAGKGADYSIRKSGNGVYAFVIKGTFIVNGQQLDARDAAGITAADTILLTAYTAGAEILLMDIPMTI